MCEPIINAVVNTLFESFRDAVCAAVCELIGNAVCEPIGVAVCKPIKNVV